MRIKLFLKENELKKSLKRSRKETGITRITGTKFYNDIDKARGKIEYK